MFLIYLDLDFKIQQLRDQLRNKDAKIEEYEQIIHSNAQSEDGNFQLFKFFIN